MENKKEPISFSDFIEEHKDYVPSFVYDAINMLLHAKWNGYSAVITEEDIVHAIERPDEYKEMSYIEFYDLCVRKNWLVVKGYRGKGWDVTLETDRTTNKIYYVFKEGKNEKK